MWQILLAFVIARLKEPSTWRGIIAILTAAGIPIAPEWQTWILTTGLGLIGAINVITPEPPKLSPR